MEARTPGNFAFPPMEAFILKCILLDNELKKYIKSFAKPTRSPRKSSTLTTRLLLDGGCRIGHLKGIVVEKADEKRDDRVRPFFDTADY